MQVPQTDRCQKCSDNHWWAAGPGCPTSFGTVPHQFRNAAPLLSERRPTWIGISAPLPSEWSHEEKRDDGNEMMLLALIRHKNLD